METNQLSSASPPTPDQEIAELRAELHDVSREYVNARLELAALTAAHAQLQADAQTLLRGFEEGVFVRSTDGDTRPDWAIKLFPFVQAMGRLMKNSASGTGGEGA